jgi:hypothetical protein
MKKFKSKNPQFEYLHKKWLAKNKHYTQKFIDKHLRHIALGSLGGAMLLTTPGLQFNQSPVLAEQSQLSITASTNKNLLLASELVDKIPADNSNLTPGQEQQISQLISKDLGIKVAPEIDGVRLNRTYGLIGGEQHLYRYPGDNLLSHAKTTQDWAMYGGAGIAPGLGAWGYFAPSKEALTPLDEQRERYYIAVQTFLAPGFSENVAKYRDFFKYRKMLVISPQTGQTVVVDIADAGPGESTGKQLGGSPEVMQELGLASGPRKGEVLYFFIDDPSDSIPLGPVKVQERRV